MLRGDERVNRNYLLPRSVVIVVSGTWHTEKFVETRANVYA